MVKLASWLCVATLACTTSACMLRRGTPWVPAAVDARREQAGGGITLVLLGNAGAPGRAPAHVAAEVDRVLARAEASQSTPIVLWLGNNVLPDPPDVGDPDCVAADGAWSRRGVKRLDAVVREHLARGRHSYAVLGELDWRCDLADSEIQAEPRGAVHPWTMPAAHYVVRVMGDGTSRIVSECSDGACTLQPLLSPDQDVPTSEQALVELVMVDPTAWLHRDAMSPTRSMQSIRELSSLLGALDASDMALPRLLVTHYPIEAAGWHGLGGGDPDSTWHYLPPALQRALQVGTFAGVLAAHDRGLYADDDIGDAIKRSDKVWLRAPLLQVVSGGGSQRAAGARRLRHFTSVALLPDLYSPDVGFAVVHVDPARIRAALHARRLRHWDVAELEVPLRRAPYPAEAPTPPMQPCLRCPEIPANERP